MDYTVGSLADLISGSTTPNKLKIVQEEFKPRTPKLPTNKGKEATKARDKVSFKVKNRQKGNFVFKKSMKKEMKCKITEIFQDEVQITSKKMKEFDKDIKENHTKDEVQDSSTSVLNDSNEEIEPTLIKNKEVSKTKEEEIALIKKQHNERTVFVGNLPLNINKTLLKRKFEKFGKVETIRLRNAPIADQRVPKKVAIIKKQFHKDRKSLTAYIRYVERKDAIEATQLNGTKYKDLHIRVKLCDDKEKPDQNKAIFLGNVSFDAEEEELWRLFESCGVIESVRLIRDSKTEVCKGFGYVNFLSSDSVELALQMENVKLKNRELRIQACETKKNKNVIESKNKKRNQTRKPAEKVQKGCNIQDFQGKQTSDKKKKKCNKGNIQKKKLINKIAPK